MVEPLSPRMAIVRVVLGIAQMTAASISMVLVIQTGVTQLTLGAVVVTCLLTTTSVLLFGRRRGSPDRGA